MTILVRPATKADLPRLREFEQGVIAAERPFDSQLLDDPIQYYDLDGMLPASDVCLAVAESDGRLVGSGYVRIEESKPYVRYPRYGYLGFLFVVPEHRGQGIVQQVMAYLERWALERDVGAIHLDVYADNAPALRAYEKAGFAPHMVDMRKVIPAPQ